MTSINKALAGAALATLIAGTANAGSVDTLCQDGYYFDQLTETCKKIREVPEPSTLGLLAAALAMGGIAARGRRRR